MKILSSHAFGRILGAASVLAGCNSGSGSPSSALGYTG